MPPTLTKPIRLTVLAAAMLSPALPLHLYFAGNWYSILHDYSLGMAFGIVSYWYFLMTLVIAARLPFLDRLYGHDRVMIAHGHIAGVAVVLAFVHYWFKLDYADYTVMQVKLGVAGMGIFVAVAILTHLFMIEGRVQRIKPFNHLRRFAVKRLGADYSRVKLLHNAVSVATVLIIIHVLTAYSTAESAGRMWLMGGAGAAAIAVYLYHTVVRRVALSIRSGFIVEVKFLSPTVYRVNIQGKDDWRFAHKAGQFCYMRVMSRTCGTEEHPFTISSAPDEPHISLTIKKLGDYTERLASVKPGARVHLDGPYGTFTPDLSAGPHLFIAGGIGITPFQSIIQSQRQQGFTEQLTLMWSAQTGRELFAAQYFFALANDYPLFHFVPVVTREKPPQRWERRITEELLRQKLQNGCPHAVYICGSDSMRSAMISHLKRLGVRASRIHYERFSS
ncbi:MAG: hypothetical protein ACLFSB_11695 [Chitinispirillaceae bacterium]